jgi:transposase
MEEEDFLKAIRSGHPRERERWLAIYWLYMGENITEVKRRLKRSWETIKTWKENFEKGGKKSLLYKRSGGKARSLNKKEEDKLVEAVLKSTPENEGLSGNNWDTIKMSMYCKKKLGKEVSDELCRRLMQERKITYKKIKKSWQKQKQADK